MGAELDLSFLSDSGRTGLDFEENLETREPERDADLLGRDVPLVEALPGTFVRTVRVGAMVGYTVVDREL